MEETLFADTFSFWEKISKDDKRSILDGSVDAEYKKGQLIHRSDMKCQGAIIVLSGVLRVYIVSEEGREVTLFRIYANDSCVLSASCLLDTIAFDILIEPSEDVHVVMVPTAVLFPIMSKNPYVELYMYKKATERFSDVMWTIQQILFMGTDKRIAVFLWDEMHRQGQAQLKITHDEIAKNIGSAREVVTKVLKYFAEERIIILKRGKIEIANKKALQRLAMNNNKS
ncbi:Crp/Fnr family transcriptional regulator [bacterium D16-51]|nr:Crp/Fnr family transcriptional regulator [bacterium D16-59]RKI54445.1 Crp/Fnr family transcriptional regulator [bacterium D16-51]